MNKKIIFIILMLFIAAVLVSSCGRVIKSGWNPFFWNFSIAGIDGMHNVGKEFLIRDDMFELKIENQQENYNFESTVISLTSKYYFERGESYKVELIINNENVEGGSYQLAEDEEKIKTIKQDYFRGHAAIIQPQFLYYQAETISWNVEFSSGD